MHIRFDQNILKIIQVSLSLIFLSVLFTILFFLLLTIAVQLKKATRIDLTWIKGEGIKEQSKFTSADYSCTKRSEYTYIFPTLVSNYFCLRIIE